MDRGFLVGPSFFIDHFPDTVAAVLGDLAGPLFAADDEKEEEEDAASSTIGRLEGVSSRRE